jgi:hypothetical protein
MGWSTIDTQTQLDALEKSVCWEDVRLLEYHAGRGVRAHYPSDVSRSGYERLDVHVLLETDDGKFLELAFLHCERLGPDAFERLHLRGTVDSLKRVELRSSRESVLLFAGRVLYRRLEKAPVDGTHYWPAESGG